MSHINFALSLRFRVTSWYEAANEVLEFHSVLHSLTRGLLILRL